MATAKLVLDGDDQILHLPDEFRFEGTEIDIRRDKKTGDVILSEKPERTGSWDEFAYRNVTIRSHDQALHAGHEYGSAGSQRTQP
jgi:antitoxin VapB